jgi:hypothetical protein
MQDSDDFYRVVICVQRSVVHDIAAFRESPQPAGDPVAATTETGMPREHRETFVKIVDQSVSRIGIVRGDV